MYEGVYWFQILLRKRLIYKHRSEMHLHKPPQKEIYKNNKIDLWVYFFLFSCFWKRLNINRIFPFFNIFVFFFLHHQHSFALLCFVLICLFWHTVIYLFPFILIITSNHFPDFEDLHLSTIPNWTKPNIFCLLPILLPHHFQSFTLSLFEPL